ncbi:hypothetical protein N8964_01950, partial [Pontimonas sp.]|nr:hypothetical protein [Pontimonas sp.]
MGKFLTFREQAEKPLLVLIFLAFVVTHTVSLYRSGPLTILALAVGAVFAVKFFGEKARAPKWVLWLSGSFLLVFVIFELPIESP